MKKICERCGKEFEAREDRFRTCFDCSRTPNKIINDLLLKDYYDPKGRILPDVFVGTPEKIARIFNYDGLSMKQIRFFYNRLLHANDRARRINFESAKPILFETFPEIKDRLNRKIKGFPETFATFMQHHLNLALKDKKMLEGFYKHLKAVLAYLPR